MYFLFNLQDYKFDEGNTMLDQLDPFGDGLRKLQEGDIPNAVLFFEAAVRKRPDHAEVCFFYIWLQYT